MSCCKDTSSTINGEDKDYEKAQEEDFCGSVWHSFIKFIKKKKNYDLSNPFTRDRALQELNETRAKKASQKNEDNAVPRPKEEDDQIQLKSSLREYAYQGDAVSKFQYKKSMSRNFMKTQQERHNYDHQQSHIQLAQTQILSYERNQDDFEQNERLK